MWPWLAASALLMVVAYVALMRMRAGHRRRADRVISMNVDVNGRFVHIIGEHRYMPEHGDSYEVAQHYVLDLETKKMYAGLSCPSEMQVSDKVFRQSVEKIATTLGTPLELAKPGKIAPAAETRWNDPPSKPAPSGMHFHVERSQSERVTHSIKLYRHDDRKEVLSFRAIDGTVGRVQLHAPPLFLFAYVDGSTNAKLMGVHLVSWTKVFDIHVA